MKIREIFELLLETFEVSGTTIYKNPQIPTITSVMKKAPKFPKETGSKLKGSMRFIFRINKSNPEQKEAYFWDAYKSALHRKVLEKLQTKENNNWSIVGGIIEEIPHTYKKPFLKGRPTSMFLTTSIKVLKSFSLEFDWNWFEKKYLIKGFITLLNLVKGKNEEKI